MESRWKFSTSERIEDKSFNRRLEKFFKGGIPGLVRENIQNSLDEDLMKILQ